LWFLAVFLFITHNNNPGVIAMKNKDETQHEYVYFLLLACLASSYYLKINGVELLDC
jgi:hypothetical protein